MEDGQQATTEKAREDSKSTALLMLDVGLLAPSTMRERILVVLDHASCAGELFG